MKIAQEQGRGPGNEVTPSGNWSEDATELLTACIKAFVIFSTVTGGFFKKWMCPQE